MTATQTKPVTTEAKTYNLDEFKYVIPYLGTMLIILGLFRSVVYYGQFGLVITDYLELSEALILFSRDVAVLITTLVFSGYSVIIIISNRRLKSDSSPINTDPKYQRFITSLNVYFVLLMPYVVLVAVIFMMFLVDLFSHIFRQEKLLQTTQVYELKLLITLMIGFIVSSVLVFELPRIQQKYNINHPSFKNICYTGISLVFFLFFTYIQTLFQVIGIKNSKGNIETQIFFEEGSVKSSDTFYYIGKTTKYFFFYDHAKERAYVYPNEGVKVVSHSAKAK